MAASISFQQAVTNGSAASPLAFTCASAAGQERLVALCGIAQSPITSLGFTSVTIDGQATTQVGSTIRTTDPSSNGPVVAFFRAPGTSGTNINVAFTKVGTFFDTRGALWTLSDAGTLLASGTASVNGISGGSFPGPANLNLNTVTGGAVAAITLLYDSSSHDITWTGLTERADATTSLYGGDWFSVADLNVGSTSTPLTVSAATPSTTFSAASAQSALAVSFNPAATGTTLTAAAGSFTLTGNDAIEKFVMPLGAAGQ
jgi:hypothetical protein